MASLFELKCILTYYCISKLVTKTNTNNPDAPSKRKNSLQHVLFGSLIGTTIAFFDFYIYANAAVLVFE